MRLYLAVAALMFVLLAAHAEAEETTIEQHFANIQTKLMEFGEDLHGKTMSALKEIENSEFATKTKNWFTEQFEKVKQSLSK